MSTSPLVITAFDTSLGAMAFASSRAQILYRIWFDYADETELRGAIHATLSADREFGDASEFDDSALPSLVRRFQAYAEGATDSFADVRLDLSWATPFQNRVVALTRAIPYGQTMSYGQLALQAGFSGAARAVGSVMAKNRFPLVVPCHRIVGSGRRLGGFSSRRGLPTKSRLLAMEGAINKKGALVH